MAVVLRHKVSSQMLGERAIMLDKKVAKLFPPVGQEFTLRYADAKDTVCIEARDCECMGPDRRHQHAYLPLGGVAAALPWGSMRRIVINKIDDKTFEIAPEERRPQTGGEE